MNTQWMPPLQRHGRKLPGGIHHAKEPFACSMPASPFAAKLTARQQQILHDLIQAAIARTGAPPAGGDRCRTGFQVCQRRGKAPASPGAQGCHRTRERYFARYPPARRRAAIPAGVSPSRRRTAASRCPASRSWRCRSASVAWPPALHPGPGTWTRPTTSRTRCSSASPTTC